MEAPDKIYICDFGSELSQDWHSEHCYEKDIEYNRTDAFIKKACDAFCKVCGHYPHKVPTYICRQNCDYYKDFKVQLEKCQNTE